MKKYNFVVEGMRCASCQSNVNNAISKLNGVIFSNTNLLTGLVEVQAEDNFNPNDAIVAIVVTGPPIEESGSWNVIKRNRLFKTIHARPKANGTALSSASENEWT